MMDKKERWAVLAEFQEALQGIAGYMEDGSWQESVGEDEVVAKALYDCHGIASSASIAVLDKINELLEQGEIEAGSYEEQSAMGKRLPI